MSIHTRRKLAQAIHRDDISELRPLFEHCQTNKVAKHTEQATPEISVESEEQHKIAQVDLALCLRATGNKGAHMGLVALVECAIYDSVNVAQWLLSLNTGGATESTSTFLCDRAFQTACSFGHPRMVELLLRDPRVDPVAQSFGALPALEVASSKGHAAVVKLLLADPRVDPADGAALKRASKSGHAAVVKLLLADSRVDPSARGSEVLIVASGKGHAEVVGLLLADPRCDPAARDNLALVKACASGHAGVVKLLLADPRVDPSNEQNSAIRVSCVNGHAAVVKLLLADPRFDASASTLVNVLTSEHVEVIELLLAHSGRMVTPGVLYIADVSNRGDVLRLLIDRHPQVMLALFGSGIPCKPGGVLQNELHRRTKLSALTLLLAVRRRGVHRVGDVLREVIVHFAGFEIV
jgi:hypothetical protein